MQSVRFAGDPVLEACLAGTHRMLAPERGAAVVKVQRALADLGYDLPTYGVDGVFGAETGAAVSSFKASQGLQPTDPVVGPGTMRALDALFAAEPPAGPTLDDAPVVIEAEGTRQFALATARQAIEALQTQAPNPPDPDDRVVQAFATYMFAQPDSRFWAIVDAALRAIVANQALTVPYLVDKRPAMTDFAHVTPTLDTTIGITFGRAFFDAGAGCRHEVITHEYFHYVVGAQHHYDATTPEEALVCPHHLSELVFMIALGEVGGCSDYATCQ